MRKFNILILMGSLTAFLMVGCSGNKELLLQKDQEIAALQGRVGDLETQLEGEQRRSKEVHQQLETELAEFTDKQQILIDSINNMTVITVSDAALFGFGSRHLTVNGASILDKVANVIKNNPDRRVWIEGHTDNVPIATEFQTIFASNWELSSARAHTALKYLVRKHNISPEQLAAVGYGEHRPVSDNSTNEGRSKNRRVVIVVGSKLMSAVK